MTRSLLPALPALLLLASPAMAQTTDHSMPAMSMPKPSQDKDADQGTQPASDAVAQGQEEHAGQNMPAMPGMTKSPMPSDQAQSGTDLPAGDAPPPPQDHAADRVFPPATMARAREEFRQEQGGEQFYQIMFNLAEYQAHEGRDGYRWNGEAWFGGDIDRAWLKSEGEGTFGKGVETAEVQALYSRAVGPYFNLQAGIRHDFQPSPARTYATIGFEGLAPQMIEVEGALFLSTQGELLGRLEGYYDQRITQRLILQPRAEFNMAAQNSPKLRIGSGLSDAELGLRLRYEIRRELAPYVGVEYQRVFGNTRDFRRAAGEDTGGWSMLAGVRAWF